MPVAMTQTIVAVPHILKTLLEQIIMILPLYIPIIRGEETLLISPFPAIYWK